MGKILCGEERQPKTDPLLISLKSISLSLNVLVIVMSFPWRIVKYIVKYKKVSKMKNQKSSIFFNIFANV